MACNWLPRGAAWARRRGQCRALRVPSRSLSVRVVQPQAFSAAGMLRSLLRTTPATKELQHACRWSSLTDSSPTLDRAWSCAAAAQPTDLVSAAGASER